MTCRNAETIQNGFWTRRLQLKKLAMLHLFADFMTLKTISVFLIENSFVARVKFFSGSRFWANRIIFRPLCVYFGLVEVYFGFQRSSYTICESNLGILVYFRLVAVDYRPLSINFGPMEIDIGPYQLIFLYRISILGFILYLWESIFESGSLF